MKVMSIVNNHARTRDKRSEICNKRKYLDHRTKDSLNSKKVPGS